MNKHDPNREKLLAELFHGDWAGGEAEGFARRAAAHARRRRGIRRIVIASAGMAAVAVALLVALSQRPAPTLTVSAPSRVAAPAYEIISDEELLFQLRDQPLLVVRRENGAREFVLLEN